MFCYVKTIFLGADSSFSVPDANFVKLSCVAVAFCFFLVRALGESNEGR